MSFMDKVKDTAKGASVGSLVMGPVGVVGGAFKGTQISKQLGNLKSPSGKADTSAEEARKRAIINKPVS